jgi:outer membrane immunogenic protein
MKKLLLASVATLATVSAVCALAADLPLRKTPVIAPPPPPIWTGFYAGLNAGYNFGTNGNIETQSWAGNWTTPAGVPVVPAAGPLALGGVGYNGDISQSGFIGGGQIGYNYQYSSSVLLGAEADIQGSAIRGQSYSSGAAATGPGIFDKIPVFNGANGSTEVQGGVDWLGTVRGRIGYLWTPTLLVYGTGGLSYGSTHANVEQSAFEQSASGSSFLQAPWFGGGNQNKILTGWTAGGGAEWMFTQNWSLKAEALYWDLGRQNIQTNAIGVSPLSGTIANNLALGRTSVSYQGIMARAGVNYHFNWGAAPIIAAY